MKKTKKEMIDDWRRRNPKRKRKWEEENPNKMRNAYLKWKYGITLEMYNSLFEEQKGLCAICFEEPKKQNLGVDHDHVSGKIRGLLCSTCNSGIGLFKEDTLLLKKAIEYISKHEEI